MKRMHRFALIRIISIAVAILVAGIGVGGALAQDLNNFYSVMHHIKVGWLKLASVEVSQALESTMPIDQEFLTLCGFVLSANGQPALAREAFLRALDNSELSSSEQGTLLALIGRTYLDEHQYQEAQDYHARALETAGDEAFSLIDLALIQLRVGEFTSAQHYLDRAEAAGGSDSPRLFMVRGDVALASADYAQAIGQYQKALVLAPNDQQIYFRIKQVYQQTGAADQLKALVEQARSYGIELN